MAIPGLRPQANVSGVRVWGQIIGYFGVLVGIAGVQCWNVHPTGAIPGVADVV